MKKVTIKSKSVTETGGVFEDLDAIRELKNAVSNPDIYFTDEDSVQCTALIHERPDVLSEAQNS